MEFWEIRLSTLRLSIGVEVKPGQTVKCEPGDEKFLHLSQASLGEVKKDRGAENVPISVKINDQKLILGTLSAEKCAQIQYDLVFEKEFELSHGSRNTSVFFVGYKSIQQGYESEDDFFDSDSEDDIQIDQEANGKGVIKSDQGKPTTVKVGAVKDDSTAKAKGQTGEPDKADKPKSDGSNEDDEDDDDQGDSEEEYDDDDGEVTKGMIDSDDDEISADEEANLKTEINKKRAADGVLKTPVPGKKAKVITPAGNQKTGGDGKKGGQPITPHHAKQTGKKTPASGDKAKQQTPKSSGSLACKSRSKSFNTKNAPQAHIKAKHSGAAK